MRTAYTMGVGCRTCPSFSLIEVSSKGSEQGQSVELPPSSRLSVSPFGKTHWLDKVWDLEECASLTWDSIRGGC